MSCGDLWLARLNSRHWTIEAEVMDCKTLSSVSKGTACARRGNFINTPAPLHCDVVLLSCASPSHLIVSSLLLWVSLPRSLGDLVEGEIRYSRPSLCPLLTLSLSSTLYIWHDKSLPVARPSSHHGFPSTSILQLPGCPPGTRFHQRSTDHEEERTQVVQARPSDCRRRPVQLHPWYLCIRLSCHRCCEGGRVGGAEEVLAGGGPEDLRLALDGAHLPGSLGPQAAPRSQQGPAVHAAQHQVSVGNLLYEGPVGRKLSSRYREARSPC